MCRLCRVLRQPRGNALLVGVGGSGKQSLTRFAAHISGCRAASIELRKAYGMADFREDLKKLCRWDDALHLHAQTCMHMNMYLYIQLHVNILEHVPVLVCVHVHVHVTAQIPLHVYAHAHMCLYVG